MKNDNGDTNSSIMTMGGRKGGLFGSYLDPNVRQRFDEMSTELQVAKVNAPFIDFRGMVTGAQLAYYSPKFPYAGRDIRNVLYRTLFDKVDDYDNSHQRSFFNMYPELNIASVATANTKTGPIRALVNLFFEYSKHMTELEFYSVQALQWLRVDKFDASRRIGANLKFSKLNTDMRIMKGAPLPAGLSALALANLPPLIFKGDNGEATVALPLLGSPDDLNFEFSGTALTIEAGYNRYEMPTLWEMAQTGSWDLDANTQALGKLVTGNGNGDYWGNTSSYGMISRFIYLNLLQTRDLIYHRYALTFLQEDSTITRLFRDDLGVFDSSYDWTSLGKAVRSTSPAEGVSFAERYLSYFKGVGPIMALPSTYTAGAPTVLNASALPDTSTVPETGSVDLSTRDLIKSQLAAGSTRVQIANILAAELPYVGFYITGNDYESVLQKFLGASSGDYLTQTIVTDLSVFTTAQLAWINFNRCLGIYTNDAVDLTAGNSFFYLNANEAPRYAEGTGFKAVSRMFLLMLGQIAGYMEKGKSLADAITAVNANNHDWYMDPYLVSLGYFIPQFRSNPMYDDKNLYSCGLYKVLSIGEIKSNLYNRFVTEQVTIPVGFNASAIVTFDAGATNASNPWLAMKTLLQDVGVWVGSHIFETPNHSLLSGLVSRATWDQPGARVNNFLTLPPTFRFFDVSRGAIPFRPITRIDSGRYYDFNHPALAGVFPAVIGTYSGADPYRSLVTVRPTAAMGYTLDTSSGEISPQWLGIASTGMNNDMIPPKYTQLTVNRNWIPLFYWDEQHPDAQTVFNLLFWAQNTFDSTFGPIEKYDPLLWVPPACEITSVTLDDDVRRILDVAALERTLYEGSRPGGNSMKAGSRGGRDGNDKVRGYRGGSRAYNDKDQHGAKPSYSSEELKRQADRAGSGKYSDKEESKSKYTSDRKRKSKSDSSSPADSGDASGVVKSDGTNGSIIIQ